MNRSGCFVFLVPIVCEPWSWWLHNVHSHFDPLSSSSSFSTMNFKQLICITFHHHQNYLIGLLATCVSEQLNASQSKDYSECNVKNSYLFVYFMVTQLLAHASGNLNPDTLLPVSCRNLCRDTHFRESPAFPAPTTGALTARPRHRLMMSCGRFQLSSWASAVHTALRQQQVLHITVTVTRMHVHTQTHTPHRVKTTALWSAAKLQTGPRTKNKYHPQWTLPTCTCILAKPHNSHLSNSTQHSLIVPSNTCKRNVTQLPPPPLALLGKHWLNINQWQKPHNCLNHRLRRIEIKRSFIPVTRRNRTTVRNQLKVEKVPRCMVGKRNKWLDDSVTWTLIKLVGSKKTAEGDNSTVPTVARRCQKIQPPATPSVSGA